MTSQGKRPRMTPGDWCHSGDSERAFHREFLTAVQQVAPQVVDELRESVLPVFRDPYGKDALGTYQRWADALTAWADRWHINYPWVLEHARENLHLWESVPAAAAYGWNGPGGGGWFPLTVEETSLLVFSAGQYWKPWEPVYVPDTVTDTSGRSHDVTVKVTPPLPQHIVRGWDPAYEPRAVVSDRLHKAVDDLLDYMERRLVEEGFEKAPDKRVPDHFLWLARRVCLRHSCSRIAEDDDHSNDSVIKRTNELAKTLGLKIPGAVRGWAARAARKTTNDPS